MKQGSRELLLSGKCLLHQQGGMSSIPSVLIKSQASQAVLAIPVLECEDKIIGAGWRACLAETAGFRVMKSLCQKTRGTVTDK